MRTRRLSVLPVLAVCSVSLAACGTTHPSATQAATTPRSSPRPSHSQLLPGCGGAVPPRHAWATEVSVDGHVRWQVPLPTFGSNPQTEPSPVTAGNIALFAQDGVVHALQLADGHQLWSWAGNQSSQGNQAGQDGDGVYGMWPWHGTVAILTDQVSTHARLTGLDAATGRVVWTVRLPGDGLDGNLAATADGGLAMVGANGKLLTVDIGTGQTRWTQPAAAPRGPVAVGGTVITGAGGRLTGYDDRSGQVRWTRSGVPEDPVLQILAGLVLVTSGTQGPGDPTALTAVNPATGQVAWRFDPGMTVSVLSAGPAGLAVTTYFDRALYLIDLATGRVRWHATTFIALDSVPLVTATDVISLEGGAVDYPTSRIADRSAADGTVRWTRTLSTQAFGPQPVLAIGSQAVVQTSSAMPGRPAPLLAFQAASGQLAWRVEMPTLVQNPPLLLPGRLLIQAADPGYACPA
jgi:outer membrane protein assembly factor BamB